MEKPMRKIALTTALLAALPVVPSLALASSEHELSANIGLVSDYRYRGISQTEKKPALQGGFDYAHASGAYAGVWASNVSWIKDSKSSLEIDVYGGFAGEAAGVSYDLGLLQYTYPGGKVDGLADPNTLEAYIGTGWGPVSVKYSHSLTNLFGFEDSEGSWYLQAGLDYDVGPVTLEAHAGRQKIKNHFGYSDYKLGASTAFGGFDFGLHYVKTTIKEDSYAKGGVVFSVSRQF
jgi:uncharacterized protein (TIGR02001 family)